MASKSGSVVEVKDKDHFPKYLLTHSNSSTVEIYLHGATVTSWKILGTEILYLSEKAQFAAGKALRGGIPVIFPQFGPGKLPQHGFARSQPWHFVDSKVHASGDVQATFLLRDNAETRKQWDYAFELKLTVLLKLSSLVLKLEVQNKDSKPFDFIILLHTYLAVSHINKVTVSGLKGFQYIDKVDGGKTKEEKNELVRVSSEVDRVYIGAGKQPVQVSDGGNGDIIVTNQHFHDFVVWNPWEEKTKGMSDMPPDGYTKFVCVESGSVSSPVTLHPNAHWAASSDLSLRLLASI